MAISNDKWKLKEKRDAKDFQGTNTRGSGNQWFSPGDIKTDKFLIECKQTDKKSYALHVDRLDKIYEEALFSNRIPVMSLQIQDKEVIVLFKEDFLKLSELYSPNSSLVAK